MKNLLIFSHSYFETSRVNKILLEILRKNIDHSKIKIRNLDDLYGTDYAAIDIQAEQKCLLDAERIIFQFPIFWYSMPPMLKGYMDQVFARHWAYDEGGNKLQGKQLQVIATAGMSLQSYSKNGRMQATLDEVILPLKLTTRITGMVYLKPFFITKSRVILEDEIKSYYQDYLSLFD